MSDCVIEVTAPSRLHFGLLSFNQPAERHFGGVGAMIDTPGLRLRISSAERFSVVGSLAERARQAAERMVHEGGLDKLPNCQIDVTSAPAEHAGLGTGTQLTLAVVAGLHAFAGGEPLTADVLAAWSGRA